MKSAWAHILDKDGSDEWLALCNLALEEIRTETRTETRRFNARLIRETNPDRSPDFSDGAEWAADLIDPEKG